VPPVTTAVAVPLVPPKQFTPVLEELTEGFGLTVMEEPLEPAHPAEVPVTEYVVLMTGDTLMEAVVAPVDHKKDAAPDAVNVADDPEQILLGPEIETTGF
jgi:hypothetical protein